MFRGKDLEDEVYEPDHIESVLAEIHNTFPYYFEGFAQRPLRPVFKNEIAAYEKEHDVYQEYLDLRALKEFEYDPNAFKSYTRSRCPIIRRCLMSRDEVMKEYQRSFNLVSGRELLDTVRNIAEFGKRYVADFDDKAHIQAETYDDLGLEPLNERDYQCYGVVGYGVQSSMLYGLYSRNFAHRSQNAVWALYFLSRRKDFGLEDGSEFLMVHADYGTCEQNYFYPAELFGFYALKVYLRLKSACEDRNVRFDEAYRYCYLSAFLDHVADTHREDINMFRISSTDRESRGWF